MKRVLLAALLGLGAAGCVSTSQWSEAPRDPTAYGTAPVGWWGGDVASVELFHAPLSPYGRWYTHPS